MSSENLNESGDNPHDSTRNNADKDLKYDIRRISHTLDVVLGRLETLEIRSKSAERSRVSPSSLLTSQGALGDNLPDQGPISSIKFVRYILNCAYVVF